ncbi:hypothetical protein BDF21DRAFT_396435 [Thamnidium elegans]|nr:hypothetical protein BDF21DRAFT_396435 [Thamnidium elegans]
MSSNLYYIFFRCFFLVLYNLHGGDCSSKILVTLGTEKIPPSSTWCLSKYMYLLTNTSNYYTYSDTNSNDPFTLPYCPASHLNHGKPHYNSLPYSLSFYAGGDGLSKQVFYARDTVAAGNNTSFYPLMVLRYVGIVTMRYCKGSLRLEIIPPFILIPELAITG